MQEPGVPPSAAIEAQQSRQVPAARVPFRIIGGLVAAMCLLVLGLRAAEVWRGEIGLVVLVLADYVMLASAVAMGLAFGAVAITGQVPEGLWKLFQRVMRPDP